MTSQADAMFESTSRSLTIAYGATYATAGMITVIVLALIATAIITAFIARRPGGYWMLSGVVAFAGYAGLAWYYASKPYLLLGADIHVTALLTGAKYVAPFLYSVGMFRLAWSLRKRGAVIADQ